MAGEKKFNGGIDGHSAKWSERNRRPNSFRAGQGNSASRNQGLGAAGKANTIPTDGVDTTKMSPDEKMKYFKSLGLMPNGASEVAKSTNEPIVKGPGTLASQNKFMPTKNFVNDVRNFFSTEPQLMKQIFDTVAELPVGKQRAAKEIVFRELQDLTSDPSADPKTVYTAITNQLMDLY